VTVFDGYLYSAGVEKEVKKWNLTDGAILANFPAFQGGTIMCMAYGQETLYTGSLDGSVLRWDARNGTHLFSYYGRNIKLRAVVAWRNLIISGGEDDMITAWDTTVDSTEPFAALATNSVSINCLVLSENLLYSGSSDRIVRQWDLALKALTKTFAGNIPLL
jgi:F-box and WD-40 domain protein 1/11